MSDHITRLRRMNRAVTTRSGALNSSFLGLGRPLGTARVLNAIGQGKTNVSDLRAYLDLDSGLLSRLLRSLETEGLIETHAARHDARQRNAVLTPTGKAEFARYEALSDQAAQDILDSAPDPDALLKAADLIATILGQDQIRIFPTDPQDPRIDACMQHYFAEVSTAMGLHFDPGDTSAEDLEAFRAPNGLFLLALSDGVALGCGAIRRFDTTTCEVKRVWVSDTARGLGVARRIMRQLEDAARLQGAERLVLDTHGALHAAMAMYKKAGWVEIDRYNDNPYAQHFFEKRL